ncbi:MAG: 4-hydroxy-tetrahydrodipicolinate reductase [Vicingaceae bacterium]
MKLAIIGYGKMGKVIEKVALERGHEIVLKVNRDNADQLRKGELNGAEAGIEFSRPESAVENILSCFKHKLPIAVGTTGWYDQWDSVQKACEENQGALVAATNFSVGVNLFFELNKKLAELMSKRSEYNAVIEETHHTEKLDSPSGTAITIAEGLIEKHSAYQKWENQQTETDSTLDVISYREPEVPGTHTVTYDSPIDKITIEHQAKNREGFALGSVLAAEFLVGKTGIFQMKDVLKF